MTVAREPVTAEVVVSRRGHPQIRIAGSGYEALVDEGIADDVLLLWRRRVPTFASCQGGDPDLLGGGRYVACRRFLPVRRAQELAERLGWVDHVVWTSPDTTAFYDANRHPAELFGLAGILLMPRASASP